MAINFTIISNIFTFSRIQRLNQYFPKRTTGYSVNLKMGHVASIKCQWSDIRGGLN